MPRGIPKTPENQREFNEKWLAPKGKLSLKKLDAKTNEAIYSRLKYVDRLMSKLKANGGQKKLLKTDTKAKDTKAA